MNAKPFPAISPFVPDIGPAHFANWQAGADQHSGARNGHHLDLVEGIQGEGLPASRPDPKNHHQRYETDSRNGARGAFAGLSEAFRCALGISKDRSWIDYVVARRREMTKKAEAIFSVKSDAGDAR